MRHELWADERRGGALKWMLAGLIAVRLGVSDFALYIAHVVVVFCSAPECGAFGGVQRGQGGRSGWRVAAALSRAREYFQTRPPDLARIQH